MRPVATATHVAWSLCVRVSQSAYLLATSASPAKTDEPIEMLFGVRNPGTVGRYHTVDNFRSFFQSFEKHCGCLLLSMPQTLSPYVKVSAQGVPLVRDGNEITSNFGVKCQKTLFWGRGVNTRFQAKGLQY